MTPEQIVNALSLGYGVLCGVLGFLLLWLRAKYINESSDRVYWEYRAKMFEKQLQESRDAEQETFGKLIEQCEHSDRLARQIHDMVSEAKQEIRE